MSSEPLALGITEILSSYEILLRKQATPEPGFQFLKNYVALGVRRFRQCARFSCQRDHKSQAILQVVKLGLLDQPFCVHVPVLQHKPWQGLKQSCLQLLLAQCDEEKLPRILLSARTSHIGKTRISQASQV